MPKYSLWLQPDGELKSRLHRHITSLSKSFQGPVFEPHVTLIPGFDAPNRREAIAATEKIAQDLQAYEVQFDKVDSGKVFFQCVYILCKKTSDTLRANAVAVDHLGLAPWDYMPHLSLLYSDLPFEQRQEIAATEGGTLFNEEAGIPTSFRVDRLALWETDPDDTTCTSWALVQNVKLQ